MFNDISWTDFIIFIFLVTVAYYVVIILLFFRKEFINLLRGHGRPFRQAEFPQEKEENNSGDSIMGAVRPDAPNHESTPSELLEFGPHQSEDEFEPPTAKQATLQTGSVADLAEEIKSLSQILHDNQSTREEIASLFQSLLERYPHLIGTPAPASINELIVTELNVAPGLNITTGEVENWWPSKE